MLEKPSDQSVADFESEPMTFFRPCPKSKRDIGACLCHHLQCMKKIDAQYSVLTYFKKAPQSNSVPLSIDEMKLRFPPSHFKNYYQIAKEKLYRESNNL
jgi:hypothetical protein